jgi:hypothetical protein
MGTQFDSCCEIDHLIPLELGGSNDVKNLWPQPQDPRPGSFEKDSLENDLHHRVCNGEMSLTNRGAEMHRVKLAQVLGEICRA